MANNEQYAYDLDGNRISQTVNGAVSSFVISPTSNRLMGVSGSGAESYGYDQKGNLLTVDGAPTFQYNPFNRLANTSGGSDYVNPDGQRLRKVTGVGTTYFAWEGNNLLAESDAGQWTDYVWINGRLIGQVNGNAVNAVHNDQLGRPQLVTDATASYSGRRSTARSSVPSTRHYWRARYWLPRTVLRSRARNLE